MLCKLQHQVAGAAKAGQMVPFTTQAPIGSTDPLDLYTWLENYETKTGGQALAIAPSTYYAAKARPPSAATARNPWVR